MSIQNCTGHHPDHGPLPHTTRKRRMLLDLLANAPRPMSAEELYFTLQKETPLDRSTVYRALAQFAEKGILQRTVGDDGVAYYALPEEHRHQHQLICSRCGASVPVEGCPVEALASRLAVTTGFQITGHRLELYGLCPKCAKPSEEHEHKEEAAP